MVRLVSREFRQLFGACATIVLRFTLQTAAQRQASRTLRTEIESLPAIPNQDDFSSHEIWTAGRRRLRELILNCDPRGFLTWDIVTETMFPLFGAFVREELKLLRQNNWSVWRSALREPRLGLPFPCFIYPFSSTNTIHHAYHLCRFQLETSSAISDYSLIIEFGGGYGSLCRLCQAIGFRGKYILFDFPEQSALQRYYLSSIGLPEIVTISDVSLVGEPAESAPEGPRLFIATWSLSESAIPLRRQIAGIVKFFDAFLIAYQEEFPGIDNPAYFQEWQAAFPDVAWTESKIMHLPGNRYLFGSKKAPDRSRRESI